MPVRPRPAKIPRLSPPEPERYEPLPGLVELPAWVWRKIGRVGRAAVIAVLVASAVTAAILVPQSRETSAERAADERRARAEARAERIEALKAEQRPVRGISVVAAPATEPRAEQLRLRAAMVAALEAEIDADATRRVRDGELEGEPKRTECEPFPRPVAGVTPAARDLGRREGRFACVAVSSEFGRDAASDGGIIGHPYRALVDFETGRYAFCKVTGVTGPSRNQPVVTPRACGGR